MTWFQLFKTIAALAGVLGLILGLAYFLRRFNLAGTASDGSNSGWRVVGIKLLGPKRQVYILEVGSHLLLIGATDRTMTKLMEITDPAEREAVIEAVSRKSKAVPNFRDFLKRAES
ncbi:MAG: FliO/MopB family protein [Calditrichota bacterium]